MYLTEANKTNGKKKEVPPLNIHRFSCELVFFLVANNSFNLNITGIDKKYENQWVELTIFPDDNDIETFNDTKRVINNGANFSIKLNRRLKDDDENIEKIA
jgi:hypothetical protein